MQHRSRGNAGEDAFLLGQTPGRDQRIVRGNQDLAIEHCRVKHRRDEALVETAQALDAFARVRFGRDHLHARLFFFQSAAGARQGASGPQTSHKMGDLR